MLMPGRGSPLGIFPIIIGINAYRDTRFEPLQFAVKDADRIFQFLTTPNSAFQIRNPQILRNQEATLTNVTLAIGNWNGKLPTTAHDALLLYFSGHGMTSSGIGGTRAYLCCYDADPVNPQNGGLRLDDLFVAIQKIEKASIIIITDACESGSLLHPGLVTRDPAEELNSALTSLIPVGDRGCRVVMTAVAAERSAIESDAIQGGIFTDALLRGWRGMAAAVDGIVTPTSLKDYLDRFFAQKRPRPVNAVSGGAILTLGARDERLTPLASQRPEVSLRSIPSSLGDQTITNQGGFQVAEAAPPPYRAIAIIGGISLFLLVVSSILIVTVPALFVAAFVLAALMACAAPFMSPEGLSSIVALFSVVQLVVLLGVAHLRFGLLRGFGLLNGLSHVAFVAIIIFFFQLGAIIFNFTADE